MGEASNWNPSTGTTSNFGPEIFPSADYKISLPSQLKMNFLPHFKETAWPHRCRLCGGPRGGNLLTGYTLNHRSNCESQS